jgi:hypothetical protein
LRKSSVHRASQPTTGPKKTAAATANTIPPKKPKAERATEPTLVTSEAEADAALERLGAAYPSVASTNRHEKTEDDSAAKKEPVVQDELTKNDTSKPIGFKIGGQRLEMEVKGGIPVFHAVDENGKQISMPAEAIEALMDGTTEEDTARGNGNTQVPQDEVMTLENKRERKLAKHLKQYSELMSLTHKNSRVEGKIAEIGAEIGYLQFKLGEQGDKIVSKLGATYVKRQRELGSSIGTTSERVAANETDDDTEPQTRVRRGVGRAALGFMARGASTVGATVGGTKKRASSAKKYVQGVAVDARSAWAQAMAEESARRGQGSVQDNQEDEK